MRNPLLDHWFWKLSEPDQMRLARIFVLELGSLFEGDGIILKMVAGFGESLYHKWSMAREGILDGIKKGTIVPGTIVVEATSGNTGHAMAIICTILGLRFVAVLGKDVPSSKVDVIRALGEHVGTQTPNTGETTVDCARRLGAQEGWYNPDQYSGAWNPDAHERYLMPQVFDQMKVSIFVAVGGTMGTCLGAKRYAYKHGLLTEVVPVMCAEGQEVPAGRTLARVKKDIRLPWEAELGEGNIQFGTRAASFLLSFLSWRLLPGIQPGPSSGLALAGALKFLWRHKQAGTLDRFREDDGTIHVVVFCPDDYRPYHGLYLAERLYDRVYEGSTLSSLLALPDVGNRLEMYE